MDRLKKIGFHLSENTRYVWLGLVCVWALIFTPHLLHSGFVSDDWGVVRSGLTIAGFWDLYASWFPLFSNRPAAPLILSVFSKLCGGEPGGYIIANLVMWLAGLIIIARVLLRFLSIRFVVIFLSLASFPSIASTVLFSVGMQLVGVASILFWAISLYLLDCHLTKQRYVYLIASYFFVLLSLLTYEIILPFLVISMLYPALFDFEFRKAAVKNHVNKYILPTFLLLVAISLFQTIIMPFFMPVYSRLSPGSLSSCLASLMSWFWALLVDFPILLVDALQRVFLTNYNEFNLGIVSIVVAGVFAFLLFGTSRYRQTGAPAGKRPDIGMKYLLLCIAVLALLSASFLFMLSGASAHVGGYANRGMTSTWILLALVVAIVSEIYWRRVFSLFVLTLIVLNACSFMLQRENYANSWTLQNEIARSLVKTFREAKVPLEKATVLAHVPPHVPSSYNNEEVFLNSWDLSGALWFADHSFSMNAMPLNPGTVKHLSLTSDGVSLTYWKSDFSNFWFYEYNARFGNDKLSRISDMSDMKAVAEQVSNAKFNVWPLSVPVRIREALNNHINVVMLGIVLCIYLSACLVFFRRRKHVGSVTVSGSCCRVCGGILFNRLKDSDVSTEDITPADFKVTDSSYGATCAIERCAGCGFLQSDCSDVLSYYQLMEDPEYESGRLARIRQFNDILKELSRWKTGGRLLDVGAGTGMLVEQALAWGFEAQGIEPSEWMALQAEKRGLPVIAGTLPDQRVAGPYGAITLLDVIEHVSDPSGTLARIHDLLEPSGYLLLTTPDVDSFAAKVMGKRWWHFRIAHISYFNSETIDLLLQRSGFEVVQIRRTGWYFELSYLVERLIVFIPGVSSFPLPKMVSKIIVPLNLFDSMLLVCRKKS